ncbi:hypothetical protein Sviol_67600 [Streptomyces violascens]|uniref:Uncharacterized protein n=1 Tax=Streptomyces violascens TaxID=67381 RepID=A0ABQ3QYJ1_9ACTN|nr:hypothetical protein Sviol_67600 [Streptomyces violascens]
MGATCGLLTHGSSGADVTLSGRPSQGRGQRRSKGVAIWHLKCHTRVMDDDDTDFLPGDGPSSGISVSLTAGTLQGWIQSVVATP